MFEDLSFNSPEADNFAQLGTDAITYLRKISAEEVEEKFPGLPDLESGVVYWAMFAADGTPLMLSDSKSELTSSAHSNDLTAILPN
jgi:hypothetical protein